MLLDACSGARSRPDEWMVGFLGARWDGLSVVSRVGFQAEFEAALDGIGAAFVDDRGATVSRTRCGVDSWMDCVLHWDGVGEHD